MAKDRSRGKGKVKGGKPIGSLGKGDLSENAGDILESIQRKKILKRMWDALEAGELNAREELAYMQEIAKLESFQREKDRGVVYEVVLKVEGLRVCCGECGNEIVVQRREGEFVCVSGGDVVKGE